MKNIFLFLLCLFPAPIFAAGNTIDCSDISINYSDEKGLTREEKLARMDKALMDSLNKFELCQQAALLSGSSSNSGNNGNGGKSSTESISGQNNENSTGSENTGELENGYESVASSELSGTETPPGLEDETSYNDSPQQPPGLNQKENNSIIRTDGQQDPVNEKPISGNGKVPEDIPPANNDDTLAAQIRYAAENEPDPEKKKMLWNEYRKYKGLPTK